MSTQETLRCIRGRHVHGHIVQSTATPRSQAYTDLEDLHGDFESDVCHGGSSRGGRGRACAKQHISARPSVPAAVGFARKALIPPPPSMRSSLRFRPTRLTSNTRQVLYRITAPAIAAKHPNTPPTTPPTAMPRESVEYRRVGGHSA
jgi:hypothetical protein